jgi:hypothetical protein
MFQFFLDGRAGASWMQSAVSADARFSVSTRVRRPRLNSFVGVDCKHVIVVPSESIRLDNRRVEGLSQVGLAACHRQAGSSNPNRRNVRLGVHSLQLGSAAAKSTPKTRHK